MDAGIWQGCPLSPLLFAVVADLLLRKLARSFPDELLRAFADDTAMVIKDWWANATAIDSVFEEFGTISGFNLNMPKTVVIPLWPTDFETVRLKLAKRMPVWRHMRVAGWATYLGLATGPEKWTTHGTKPFPSIRSVLKLAAGSL